MPSACNRIILLGAPGAGKGTVAKALVDRFAVMHLSTGDMLRAAVAAGTDVGKLAQTFMSAGALVPDEVIVRLLAERVKEPDCLGADGTTRFLLDGFPRTLPQADALDAAGLAPELVIYLQVEDEVIVRRLSGRRTCPACGNPHHVEFAIPKVAGHCDRCGTELVHRPDDFEAPIRRRLEAFAAQTGPLVGRYANVLETIDGNQAPDAVLRSVLAMLSKRGLIAGAVAAAQ